MRQALEARPEPTRPEGVELGELEAMARRIVAEELRPVRDALAQLQATAASHRSDGGSAVGSVRERMRQRRGR